MQLLGTGIQRAGKTSQVIVNGVTLTFASYEAGVEGQDLETTNFDSYNVADEQTYEEGILGKLKCSLRFGGDWDAGENPLDDPPGLFPRDDLPDLSFVVSRIDLTSWAFPYARIRTSTNGSSVGDKVTFSCSGMNQGPFSYPSGSV